MVKLSVFLRQVGKLNAATFNRASFDFMSDYTDRGWKPNKKSLQQ